MKMFKTQQDYRGIPEMRQRRQLERDRRISCNHHIVMDILDKVWALNFEVMTSQLKLCISCTFIDYLKFIAFIYIIFFIGSSKRKLCYEKN